MSSLSKIVITGKVVRNAEKRFKDNSFPITSFTINIGSDNEEKLVKVLSFGKLAETSADIQKGQSVIVEGKLQTNTVKTDSGAERKVVEINAQGIDVIGSSTGSSQESSGSDDSASTDFDFAEDVGSDELIGEDEIPF